MMPSNFLHMEYEKWFEIPDVLWWSSSNCSRLVHSVTVLQDQCQDQWVVDQGQDFLLSWSCAEILGSWDTVNCDNSSIEIVIWFKQSLFYMHGQKKLSTLNSICK